MAIPDDVAIYIQGKSFRECLEEHLTDAITYQRIVTPFFGLSGHSLGFNSWDLLRSEANRNNPIIPMRNPWTRAEIPNLSNYICRDDHINDILWIMSIKLNEQQLWCVIFGYVKKYQQEVTVIQNTILGGQKHWMFNAVKDCCETVLSLHPNLAKLTSHQARSESALKINNLHGYQQKLTKEINSRWPFPNKQLKRQKLRVLELLNQFVNADVPLSTVIPAIREQFPAVVARGKFSSRMHDLLNALEADPIDQFDIATKCSL